MWEASSFLVDPSWQPSTTPTNSNSHKIQFSQILPQNIFFAFFNCQMCFFCQQPVNVFWRKKMCFNSNRLNIKLSCGSSLAANHHTSQKQRGLNYYSPQLYFLFSFFVFLWFFFVFFLFCFLSWFYKTYIVTVFLLLCSICCLIHHGIPL